MTVTRIGVEGSTGTDGQHLPFVCAAGAGGWLFASGQTPMANGGVVGNGIVEQSYQTAENVLAILAEMGCGPEHVARRGVWLDDPRDSQPSNKVFKEYFGANPPACACVASGMIIGCKVEVGCVAYKKPQSAFS